MTDNNDLAVNFVSDFMSFFMGIPTGTLGQMAKEAIERRALETREALIQEIKAAGIGPESVQDDEFVACVWRIHMAIVQGASIENTKLLAKMIVGLVNNPNPIYADRFLHYANSLEGLSYEELFTLAKIWEVYEQLEYNPGEDGGGTPQEVKEKEISNKRNRAAGEAQSELVGQGKIFSHVDEYGSTLSSLARTGLLIPLSGYGSLVYKISPKFEELVKLINCKLSELCD